MNNTNLYIIGNGFDLHHGIQSSYSSFRAYLKQVDNSLFDLVEEYLSPDENWSDLEESLASLDSDYLAENASGFLVSYGAEDWSDSYHHDYQYEIEQIVESLSSRLREKFTAWIRQLYIPSTDEIKKLLEINNDAIYLSFNYTNTLEKVYGIPKSNTLFIHGYVNSGKTELILGHAWNPADILTLNEDDYERLDTRVIEGDEIINRYFHQTFKQTSKVIEVNETFFNNLENISDIYVLGHSLSYVDKEYFEVIVKTINRKKVQWKVSYHNKHELARHQDTMKELGIYKSNLQFFQLDDLSENKF